MSDPISTEGLLSQLVAEAKETNRWLRVMVLPTLRDSLAAALKKADERKIYQASDGRGIREVADASGAGYGTVHGAWQRWAKIGLVEQTTIKGRYQRLVDLNDIGIEVELGAGKSRYSKRDKTDKVQDRIDRGDAGASTS